MKYKNQLSLIIGVIIVLSTFLSCKQKEDTPSLTSNDGRDQMAGGYAGTYSQTDRYSEVPDLNREDYNSGNSIVVVVNKDPNKVKQLLIKEKQKGANDFSKVIISTTITAEKAQVFELTIPIDTFFFEGGYIVTEGLNSYRKTGQADGSYNKLNGQLVYAYRFQQTLLNWTAPSIPKEFTTTVHRQ